MELCAYGVHNSPRIPAQANRGAKRTLSVHPGRRSALDQVSRENRTAPLTHAALPSRPYSPTT